MSISEAQSYYLKALDHYPYDMEVVIEALNYAHGYDEEHAGVHCLFGRIFSEQLKQFDEAQAYFEAALFYDKLFPDVYMYYGFMLINVHQFGKAWEVFESGLGIQGIDKSVMRYGQAIVRAKQGEISKAIKLVKQALKLSDHKYARAFLLEEKSRIKSLRVKKRKIKFHSISEDHTVDIA